MRTGGAVRTRAALAGVRWEVHLHGLTHLEHAWHAGEGGELVSCRDTGRLGHGAEQRGLVIGERLGWGLSGVRKREMRSSHLRGADLADGGKANHHDTGVTCFDNLKALALSVGARGGGVLC